MRVEVCPNPLYEQRFCDQKTAVSDESLTAGVDATSMGGKEVSLIHRLVPQLRLAIDVFFRLQHFCFKQKSFRLRFVPLILAVIKCFLRCQKFKRHFP